MVKNMHTKNTKNEKQRKMTQQSNEHWLRPTLKTGKPVLLFDLDGVLADFDTRHAQFQELGIKGSKMWTHPELYKDLDPIPGAIEAWHALQEKYDCYILSTPPWSSPTAWSEKRVWVEKYLGKSSKKKLILCHNKGLVAGKYLIDDRIANGVEDFEGEHIHFGTEKFPDWETVVKFLLNE